MIPETYGTPPERKTIARQASANRVAFLAIVTLGIIILLLFLSGALVSHPTGVSPAPAVNGSPAMLPEEQKAPSGESSGDSTGLLDPLAIPKFSNQLTGAMPVFLPVSGNEYEIRMTAFSEQILPPPLPETRVLGFEGLTRDAVTGDIRGTTRSAPGATFEVQRGTPITVTWKNGIWDPYTVAVDPTLHWADPGGMGMAPSPPFPAFPPGFDGAQDRVPTVIHLHGGETPASYDGHPDAWYTADGRRGPEYATARPTDANATVYEYLNDQQAATLWYHDHALGLTRINVLSGLLGMYIIRDPADTIEPLLPSGEFEIPLIIQDRTFNADGSLHFDAAGSNPGIHPYWLPEYFGDTIVVNGKAWPNMNVKRGEYRFRILDSSNARYYTLSLSNGMSFVQIGSDGGYLKSPAVVRSITLAPAERADVLIDFSSLSPGTKVVLLNGANAPFPDGDPADPATTGQVMQFTVTAGRGPAPATLPEKLNPTLTGAFPNLPAPDKQRILTLVEVEGPTGDPLMSLLNGQLWSGTITEQPKAGSTEDWTIVDLTKDTHPIHLHLIQFQLVKRQAINVTRYSEDWTALNGNPPFNASYIPKELPVEPYLAGDPELPAPAEQGWKDTIQAMPGKITVFRARFMPSDGRRAFSFDPTAGSGYVWHCHILDHEDNEMMRPYRVVP